jgi:hypothetical protein
MTDTAHAAPADTYGTPPEPNIGRTAVIGAVIGFTVVSVVVTAIATLSGMHPGSALGLGTFIGTWGGAGFGFMMGGTIPFARHLDAEAAHSSHRS